MKEITPYLTFDGNCREAMTFYASSLGAELQMMPFSEAPKGEFTFPQEAKDRVMHARLSKGQAVLMASDSLPGMPFHAGSNFSVTVDCDSAEEVESLFAALQKNGEVTMPVQDTFWGAHFGMLTDQFGINWMFNYDKPQQS